MSEELQQTMYSISEAAYSQVQQESANTQGESNTESNSTNSDDDVIDAEYTKE